jgi:8-oxo-dGTP pyrophosphatase MutT (NUDIX family)
MTTVVERDAARAIVLTPQHEVLLLRVRPPEVGESFWIAPGGGLEPGETVEECLRRELREEVGLDRFTIGPLVWRRQHTFNLAGRGRLCQRERYHVVRVEKFEARMLDEAESEFLERFQWWSADELFSTRERLTPVALADIVARYLSDGPPAEPLSVEILVD